MTGIPEPPYESLSNTPARRRLSVRAKVLLIISAVLVLSLALAIPVTLANNRATQIRLQAEQRQEKEAAELQAKQSKVRELATSDAATYQAASTQAAKKIQAVQDYVRASQESAESLLVPVTQIVVASPKDFSEDTAAWLQDSVDGIEFVIDQHWVSHFEADGTVQDWGDAAADETANETLSPQLADQISLALESDPTQLTGALQTHYSEAADEELADLRAYVKDATDQRNAEAGYASEVLLAILEANKAADDAVVAVATAAVAAGNATLESHSSASQEALAALRSAVALNEALATVDVSTGGLRQLGATHTQSEAAIDADLATMMQALPTTFNTYVSAAEKVRSSHQTAVATPAPVPSAPRITPPKAGTPEPPAAPKDDAWCTWSVFMSGFPVWVWGPCSEMP